MSAFAYHFTNHLLCGIRIPVIWSFVPGSTRLVARGLGGVVPLLGRLLVGVHIGGVSHHYPERKGHDEDDEGSNRHRLHLFVFAHLVQRDQQRAIVVASW